MSIRPIGLLVLLLTLPILGNAANTPCSGSKGGIARCDGPLFLCNDGSISGSKRDCSAEHRGAGSSALRATGNAPSDCPCGSATLCTGPRGGQYCMTRSGTKSYKRK
ncbi:hypothetical protein BVH03_17470 [Pseudomonas sp. PA15(2017)]|uniref:hypothetical protein n=1 Tax=Pseudomonas sp. PA15(2017) TaxID=1932111 RepID=UPI00095A5165|nr:hypothetical protein [Pseudomonas sp. PA15(2017)]OLU25447.1 hypothetical protein BVH03_17470 [Pseudomonas sp. PA15(2017)]